MYFFADHGKHAGDAREGRRRPRCAARPTPGRAPVLLLAVGGVAAIVTGCQQKPAPPVPDGPPLVIDEATQRRDWPPVTAHYINGDVVAGVNRFPWRPNSEADERYNLLLEPAAFVAQTAVLPFTYLWAGPNAADVFTGYQLVPTYTAVPPLPPEENDSAAVRPPDPIADTAPAPAPGTEAPTEVDAPPPAREVEEQSTTPRTDAPGPTETTPEGGTTTPPDETMPDDPAESPTPEPDPAAPDPQPDPGADEVPTDTPVNDAAPDDAEPLNK